MNEPLPHFRYHPSPIESGAVVARSITCICCLKERSHVYVGPVYATVDLSERICPWCIASGEAARTLEAEFSDPQALAASGVPKAVIEEIACRTPGFFSWQGAEWLAHCKDGCAFLGDAKVSDLTEATPETVADWCATNGQDREGWLTTTKEYVPGGQPAFYKFKCVRCGKVRLHWDLH